MVSTGAEKNRLARLEHKRNSPQILRHHPICVPFAWNTDLNPRCIIQSGIGKVPADERTKI